MNVKIAESTGCRREMTVTADADECVKDYRKAIGVYRAKGKIAGFRKGKAPDEIVEKHFGDQLRQDVQEHLVARLYAEAVKKENLDVVGLAGVSDVQFSKAAGITFKAQLDVAPHIKLPRYHKFSVAPQPVEISDEQVQHAYDETIDRFSTYSEVSDRPVQYDDIVQLDYSGAIDGQDVEEIVSSCSNLAKATGFWARIGKPEFLPGAPDQLVGAAMGEQRSVTVNFPQDFHVAEVAGKNAQYRMTVTCVREKVPPVLDEALFKKLGVESELAMRERIRERLNAYAEDAETERVKAEIIKMLLAKTEVPVPQTLLEQETRSVTRRTLERMAREGVPEDEMRAQLQTIMDEASGAAAERIKTTFVLRAIAKEENVEVSDADVDARIAEMAAQNRRSVEDVRKEIEKRGELDDVRMDVRVSRTLDRLPELITAK